MKDLDKTTRLVAHADAGERIRILLDDPVIAAFFRMTRDEFAGEMVSAPIADDEARRNAAIKIALLDDLKLHLENAVTNGERAKKALDKMKREKVDA